MHLQSSAVTAASLLLATLLSWPVQAQASWREQLPAAELVGEGTLRYFGLRIYDARLWSAAADFDPQKAFALELTYHRSISRDALVETSMDELRRLADASISEAQLLDWQTQMNHAFVDVEPGQRITGVFLPGEGARFYVGERLQHEVRDAQFARAFFAIWLDPRSRDRGLRARLLGLR
jgi:hypothetical protein